MKKINLLLSTLLLFSFIGCQTTSYYKTKALFGVEKRELLFQSVQAAKESLQETKSAFQEASKNINVVINIKDEKMLERYARLEEAYENCESEADDVKGQLDTMDDMAEAFFSQWMEEMELYTNESFRNASKNKYNQMRKCFNKLSKTLRDVEIKFKPTLSGLRDQVLFLKHNINAQSVASLEDELVTVDADIDALIRSLDNAIKEADDFITSMNIKQEEEEK